MRWGVALWVSCWSCIVLGCTQISAPDAAVSEASVSAEGAIAGSTRDSSTAVNGGGVAAIGGEGASRPTDGSSTAADGACTVPEPEQCDARDNDCDGEWDENLRRPCGAQMVGACRPGVQVCSGGQWTDCVGAVGPGDESCDDQGHDENCDGLRNEGCPCEPNREQPCGAGMCKGVQRCDNGMWSRTCAGQGQVSTETCDANNQDEDCDGMSNEDCACADGTMEVCPGNDRGPCRPGIRMCEAGQWGACTGIVGGTAESCDALDNDCDGVADNGAMCGGDTRCEGGRCVQCLTDGECQGMRPPACHEAYCDVALGACKVRFLPDRTRCAMGVCRAGSCFAGCIEDGDCTAANERCVRSRCTVEPGCGNGQLDSGEQCESGMIGETCRTLGYDGGSLTCRNCRYDTGLCYQVDPPAGGSGA